MAYRRGDYKKARRGAFGARIPSRRLSASAARLVEVAIAVDERQQAIRGAVRTGAHSLDCGCEDCQACRAREGAI